MPSATAESFIRALQQSEQTRDVEPLVEQFDDQAEVENLTAQSPARGRDGAREFWTKYLDSFQNVKSRFTHVFEADSVAVLEWISEGALPDGKPIRYRGVSVLELAGGRVRRFRTYYDSAAFVAPPAESARAEPNTA
ncbi:MAG: nuclear transport factor 2 family protein [Gemmataceae bacterium]|nr:nuclear transport factor 2 family protein [Gemmataceae bacterium]